MKAGETVRDSTGRIYQVGQQLGRGLWGRVYTARDEAAGVDCVLKVPLGAADLGGDEKLASAVREIAVEQARLQEDGVEQGLVPLLGRVPLPDGGVGLLMPKMPNSLEKRLVGGANLEELLHAAIGVVRTLRGLEELVPFHGGLKPNNIFVDGDGRVLLADPVSPALRRALPALLSLAGPDQPYLPPEVRAAPGSAPLGAPTDAYALAMALYRGAMTNSGGPDRFPELPAEGLDKAKVVALKDRVINRLKRETSNPRFHTRFAERFAAVLNRALSRETAPSPPYRFRRLDELLSRLDEVVALVHPTVTHAGKIIFDLKSGAEAFTTEDTHSFSCTVATTAGVESHDEIACGLAFFDADSDNRLRNVNCAYTVDRHPTGRFRFSFKLEGMGPGAYRVRVAYAIRESGEEPHTTEGSFRVRPAPGYVPPKAEPAPQAIPMGREEDPETNSGLPRKDARAAEVSPRVSGTLAPVVPLRPQQPEIEEGATFPTVPLPTPISPYEPEAPTAPIEPAPIRPSANLAGRAVARVAEPAPRPAEPLREPPPPLREVPRETTRAPEPRLAEPRPKMPPPVVAPAPKPQISIAVPTAPTRPTLAPPPPAPAPARPTLAATPKPAAPPPNKIISRPPEEPEVKTRKLDWTELPLPVAAAEEPARPRPEREKPKPAPAPVAVEADEDDDDYASDDGGGGPVDGFIKKALGMVKGDAYAAFIIIATVIIVSLAGILFYLF